LFSSLLIPHSSLSDDLLTESSALLDRHHFFSAPPDCPPCRGGSTAPGRAGGFVSSTFSASRSSRRLPSSPGRAYCLCSDELRSRNTKQATERCPRSRGDQPEPGEEGMFHRTLICGLLASVALFGLPGKTRACAAP